MAWQPRKLTAEQKKSAAWRRRACCARGSPQCRQDWQPGRCPARTSQGGRLVRPVPALRTPMSPWELPGRFHACFLFRANSARILPYLLPTHGRERLSRRREPPLAPGHGRPRIRARPGRAGPAHGHARRPQGTGERGGPGAGARARERGGVHTGSTGLPATDTWVLRAPPACAATSGAGEPVNGRTPGRWGCSRGASVPFRESREACPSPRV
jgi:hypothetical protein